MKQSQRTAAADGGDKAGTVCVTITAGARRSGERRQKREQRARGARARHGRLFVIGRARHPHNGYKLTTEQITAARVGPAGRAAAARLFTSLQQRRRRSSHGLTRADRAALLQTDRARGGRGARRTRRGG